MNIPSWGQLWRRFWRMLALRRAEIVELEVDTRIPVLDHYAINGGEPQPVYRYVEPEDLP